MDSAQSSNNWAADVNWKYLGLGLVILIAVGASLHLVDITSFETQPDRNPDNDSYSSQKLEIEVQIKGAGRSKRYELHPKASITAFAAVNKSHEVTYNRYEQGYFITAIGDLKQNKTHSWLYFVNGQPPTQAVNNYYLKDGDQVTYRYLGNKESKKYFE